MNDGTTFNAVAGGGGSGTVTDVTSGDSSILVTNPTTTPDLSVQDSPAVGGVTVTGTPTAGQVLTATDGSDADWQDVPGTSLEVTDGSTAVNPATELDFTSGAVVTDGGGGVAQIAISAALPPWFQSGSGSPVGSVVPYAVGALYQDTANGALYEAIGATNADWVSVGGAGDESVGGVSTVNGTGFYLLSNGAALFLSDVLGVNGSGNGLAWTTSGVDGDQTLIVQTGGSGTPLNGTIQDAAGNMTMPGQIDAAALGPTIPYVTVQTGAPAGPYQTPLVFDTTAVTGGLYGWDGSAYQKIGGPL